MFLRLARSQVRFTTRLNRVTQFPKLNESAAATSLPHTSMFRASFADWIPPPSTDDRAQSSERRPAGGGAHFPGSPPSAPLVHDHPHKSVVKIGDNEWQASVLIDGEFYELGVFPTKSEAADEVRQWNEVVNDDLLPDVLPSWLGGSRDDSNDPGAWIRPETTVGFDNPILNGEGKELIEDPVTVLEAIECLQHENGEEISLLDISTHRGGGNHIGDYLVFATGKSQVRVPLTVGAASLNAHCANIDRCTRVIHCAGTPPQNG